MNKKPQNKTKQKKTNKNNKPTNNNKKQTNNHFLWINLSVCAHTKMIPYLTQDCHCLFIHRGNYF